MKNKGFTLLYSVVVTSILLASSLSIISIALRELALTTAARDSQYAFYVANTGLECALYWDLKGTEDYDGGDPPSLITFDVFAPPYIDESEYTGTNDIICLGHDIRGNLNGDTYHYDTDAGGVYSGQQWLVDGGVSPATTQFRISFDGTADGACADVVVTKTADGSGGVDTLIESRGYNTCESSKRRVERGVELRY